MRDAEKLADTVLLAMRAELAPVHERQTHAAARVAETLAELQQLRLDVAQLRERVAVAEARPPLPGPPGPPGLDGFTPDEITVSQDADDERVLTLGYRRGEIAKSIGVVRLQAPRYCGVYERTRGYLPGDQVTHAGALWSCHTPTHARPGDGDDWQLQVKRGNG